MSDELIEVMSVSIEDNMLGAYVATMQVTHWKDGKAERIRYQVPLNELRSMRLHLDNAIDGLHMRKIDDAICGDCQRCGNTRMVQVERHGRGDWTEHCPICGPKLNAFHSKANNPTVDKKSARKGKKSK
jgi:phage FluMu protein Com